MFIDEDPSSPRKLRQSDMFEVRCVSTRVLAAFLFMPLLPELVTVEDRFCYKHDAPHGALPPNQHPVLPKTAKNQRINRGYAPWQVAGQPCSCPLWLPHLLLIAAFGRQAFRGRDLLNTKRFSVTIEVASRSAHRSLSVRSPSTHRMHTVPASGGISCPLGLPSTKHHSNSAGPPSHTRQMHIENSHGRPANTGDSDINLGSTPGPHRIHP